MIVISEKMHFKEYGFKFNLGGSLIHSSLSKVLLIFFFGGGGGKER